MSIFVPVLAYSAAFSCSETATSDEVKVVSPDYPRVEVSILSAASEDISRMSLQINTRSLDDQALVLSKLAPVGASVEVGSLEKVTFGVSLPWMQLAAEAFADSEPLSSEERAAADSFFWSQFQSA